MKTLFVKFLIILWSLALLDSNQDKFKQMDNLQVNPIEKERASDDYAFKIPRRLKDFLPQDSIFLIDFWDRNDSLFLNYLGKGTQVAQAHETFMNNHFDSIPRSDDHPFFTQHKIPLDGMKVPLDGSKEEVLDTLNSYFQDFDFSSYKVTPWANKDILLKKIEFLLKDDSYYIVYYYKTKTGGLFNYTAKLEPVDISNWFYYFSTAEKPFIVFAANETTQQSYSLKPTLNYTHDEDNFIALLKHIYTDHCYFFHTQDIFKFIMDGIDKGNSLEDIFNNNKEYFKERGIENGKNLQESIKVLFINYSSHFLINKVPRIKSTQDSYNVHEKWE